MGNKLDRARAWDLLCEYTKTPSLRVHALTVEAVMRHFAEEAGEDADVWGAVGLLHDLDYEQYPEEHCVKSAEIMRSAGIDELYIRAVCSHGFGICSDLEPQSQMEKVLYTIDELTGLIHAACLMRPSKSVLDIEVKSVKKKFKDSAFASGVNRKVILDGCERLGMSLEDVMAATIIGMRKKAAEIGLQGNL